MWRYLKKLKIELPYDLAYGSNIKDRNAMDLTEEEDIKKTWQEYTAELYSKNTQQNYTKKILKTQIIKMV